MRGSVKYVLRYVQRVLLTEGHLFPQELTQQEKSRCGITLLSYYAKAGQSGIKSHVLMKDALREVGLYGHVRLSILGQFSRDFLIGLASHLGPPLVVGVHF